MAVLIPERKHFNMNINILIMTLWKCVSVVLNHVRIQERAGENCIFFSYCQQNQNQQWVSLSDFYNFHALTVTLSPQGHSFLLKTNLHKQFTNIQYTFTLKESWAVEFSSYWDKSKLYICWELFSAAHLVRYLHQQDSKWDKLNIKYSPHVDCSKGTTQTSF